MYRQGGRSVNLGGRAVLIENHTIEQVLHLNLSKSGGVKGGNCPPPCSAGPDVHVEKLPEIVGTDSRDRAVGRSENLGGKQK